MRGANAPIAGSRLRAGLRLGPLLALVAAAAAAALLFPLPSVDEIRNYFGSTGWWGPAVFILAYAVLTLAPVPKNVMSVAAGVVFGFAAGIAVVFAAAIMDAADGAPAWAMMERGESGEDPKMQETHERLGSCMYALGHPDTGRLVPACVQHSTLDAAENAGLRKMLPLHPVSPAGAPGPMHP